MRGIREEIRVISNMIVDEIATYGLIPVVFCLVVVNTGVKIVLYYTGLNVLISFTDVSLASLSCFAGIILLSLIFIIRFELPMFWQPLVVALPLIIIYDLMIFYAGWIYLFQLNTSSIIFQCFIFVFKKEMWTEADLIPYIKYLLELYNFIPTGEELELLKGSGSPENVQIVLKALIIKHGEWGQWSLDIYNHYMITVTDFILFYWIRVRGVVVYYIVRRLRYFFGRLYCFFGGRK